MRKFAMNKDKVCTPILTFFRKIVNGSVNFKPVVVSGYGLRKCVALREIATFIKFSEFQS